MLSAGPLRRLGARAVALDEVDSTNGYLLERAAALHDGTIVCAEYQTAGRGRQGRKWLAPRGAAVMLSVLLHEPSDSPLLSGAALMAALAAAEAIEQVSTCSPGVRWPNDLVMQGRKLAGVLAESKPLPPEVRVGGRAIVIGIGINCLQHQGHFPVELIDRATSLEIQSAQAINRVEVAAALVASLDQVLVEALATPEAWSMHVQRWRDRCSDIGSRTTLEADGRRLTGTILDITEEGDLLVEVDQGGRQHFAAATTTRLW